MTPELELDLILRNIIFLIITISVIVTVMVNYYILKTLKSVSKALDSLYSVTESIDSKLIGVKENKK